MKENYEAQAKTSGTGGSDPGNEKAGRIGFEYKSGVSILGLPLIHISFAFRKNGTPIPAIGIISIGQFGAGVVNISQIGIGILSASQFTVGVFAIAQVAVAYSCIAQVGVYIHQGYGQVILQIGELINMIL